MQRLPFLDGVRGVAALMVAVLHIGFFSVNHHTFGLHDDDLERLFQFGHYGVQIFFVLSGFVIAHAIGAARVTPSYAARFIARRVIRLDPPYWATIAFVCGVSSAVARYLGEPATLPGRASLAAHVLYLQAWLGYEHISGVFWTLCIEVQFYLTFLIIAAVARRTGLSIGAASFPLLACSLLTMGGNWNSAFDASKSLLPHYALFYLGSTAAEAFGGRGSWSAFLSGVVLCTVRLAVAWNSIIAAGLASALVIAYAVHRGKAGASG